MKPLSEEFGPFNGRVWLNTAHQAPIPKSAVDALNEALRMKIEPWRIADDDFLEVPRRLKAALARLLNASADDIILGNSTSYGINLLAYGMRWQPGDEALLLAGDFPASVFPWLGQRNKGVSVRFVELKGSGFDADQLKSALTSKTRVFCASWVHSFTGEVMDLESVAEVCRDNGTWCVINGSQGVGARALDLSKSGISAIASTGCKWLCGPYGTGFAWIHPRLREELEPIQTYWMPMMWSTGVSMRDYRMANDLGAAAFDVFCAANFLNFMPWTAAVEYLCEQRVDAIEKHNDDLVEMLVKGLGKDFDLISPAERENRSAIVVFSHREKSRNREICRVLYEDGIDIAVREGNLRASPHLFNGSDDIERLLRGLG
jgi:cysteine desulfurase/selenocysteine lyase